MPAKPMNEVAARIATIPGVAHMLEAFGGMAGVGRQKAFPMNAQEWGATRVYFKAIENELNNLRRIAFAQTRNPHIGNAVQAQQSVQKIWEHAAKLPDAFVSSLAPDWLDNAIQRAMQTPTEIRRNIPARYGSAAP